MQEGETIQAIIDTRDYETMRYLFFATAKGREEDPLQRLRLLTEGRTIAIKLNDDDELVEVIPTNGVFDILLSSRFGQNPVQGEPGSRNGQKRSRRHRPEVQESRRRTRRLRHRQRWRHALHITEQGFGKRTSVDEYPTKGRGGMGVVGIKIVDEKGLVVGTLVVDDDDEVLAVTRQGVMIRTLLTTSRSSWSASGVKVISPDDDDQAASIALVSVEDDDEGEDGVEDDTATDAAET